MNEIYSNNENVKHVRVKMNGFLLNTIKILGKEETLDADLMILLIEYLNNQIRSLNEKIIDFYNAEIQDHSTQVDINQNEAFWDINTMFGKQDDLFKTKDDYIKLIQYLENELHNMQKKIDLQLKIQKRIPILSEILKYGLNIAYKDIEKKLYTNLKKVRNEHKLSFYELLD